MATATVVPSFVTSGSGGQVNGVAGTVSVPGVNLGETNTGLYSPATHQVAVTTNGAQAALWDASQNMTVPAASSHIWLGRAKLLSPSDGFLQLTNNAGTNPSANAMGLILGTNSSAGASLTRDAAGGLRAMTGNQGANGYFIADHFQVTNTPAGSYKGTANGAWGFDTNDVPQVYESSLIQAAFSNTAGVQFYGLGGSVGTNKLASLNVKSVSANTILNLAGTTTTIVQIPAGVTVHAVTARVTTLITAALSTSWALTAGAVTYATGKAFALGTTVTMADYGISFVGPTYYSSATNLVVTMNTDTATAGAIRCVVHYTDGTAPTS